MVLSPLILIFSKFVCSKKPSNVNLSEVVVGQKIEKKIDQDQDTVQKIMLMFPKKMQNQSLKMNFFKIKPVFPRNFSLFQVPLVPLTIPNIEHTLAYFPANDARLRLASQASSSANTASASPILPDRRRANDAFTLFQAEQRSRLSTPNFFSLTLRNYSKFVIIEEYENKVYQLHQKIRQFSSDNSKKSEIDDLNQKIFILNENIKEVWATISRTEE